MKINYKTTRRRYNNHRQIRQLIRQGNNPKVQKQNPEQRDEIEQAEQEAESDIIRQSQRKKKKLNWFGHNVMLSNVGGIKGGARTGKNINTTRQRK